MKSYTHGCTLKTEYNLGKQTMHNVTEQTPWLYKIISEVLCRLMAGFGFIITNSKEPAQHPVLTINLLNYLFDALRH